MSKKRTRRTRAAAADFVHDARQRAGEAYASARDSAEEAFESVYEAAEDGLDEAHAYLKRQWEDRPVAVAATALGVGLVIGLLIGSRR